MNEDLKEFVATLDCNGLRRQVNVKANSKAEAIKKVKILYPNCNLESIDEYLKS